MAAGRQRSGLKGVNRLRRVLRRIEPEITKDVRTVMDEGAEAIKLDAIAGAPRDQGDMVREIDRVQSPDGLSHLIGPGARAVRIVMRKSGSPFGTRATGLNLSAMNRHRLMQFFKAYWAEFGTKGAPGRNVPPQPARPFMQPAYDVNEDWIKGRLKAALKQALAAASRGAGAVD